MSDDDERTHYDDGRVVPGPGEHTDDHPAYGWLKIDPSVFGTGDPTVAVACVLTELMIQPRDVVSVDVRGLSPMGVVGVVYVDRREYVDRVFAFHKAQEGRQAEWWRATQRRREQGGTRD